MWSNIKEYFSLIYSGFEYMYTTDEKFQALFFLSIFIIVGLVTIYGGRREE